MKLVLFDCDGTLVNSGGVIHRCMAETFANAGLRVPELSETQEIIGLTLNLAISQISGIPMGAEVEHLTEQYKQQFRKIRLEHDFDEPLYDGIAELIDALAQQDDILLGMVTGKSRRGVISVMERHGFDRNFLVSRCADDCPSKPHPAMVLECCHETGCDVSQTFVIGDTTYDMMMAGSAGATAIGVNWGYHKPGRLSEAGAATILHHPSDLLGQLAR
ncbi:HAD-IA family hydrolase [Pseudochrobactrum algeriensis]|uniref:HAD-IA family hydrolase n=1 Tax=Pseudochrobactrum algeriensis TaxID=2834768 RepID=UPI000E241240|nr:HAD-IA family hydrolase [Pseudochrobactrum algeriensis]QVQ35718.1 HAD-IA family hydrolase [Pseudochrobactrum algeriensis]QVQ38935.1 HAD-IA family hydrolase [Pseudochrobactrum algeriensis]QVQ42852.1 HAD-IA family hydrolase [Pseudochrobactrum algeriensis]